MLAPRRCACGVWAVAWRVAPARGPRPWSVVPWCPGLPRAGHNGVRRATRGSPAAAPSRRAVVCVERARSAVPGVFESEIRSPRRALGGPVGRARRARLGSRPVARDASPSAPRAVPRVARLGRVRHVRFPGGVWQNKIGRKNDSAQNPARHHGAHRPDLRSFTFIKPLFLVMAASSLSETLCAAISIPWCERCVCGRRWDAMPVCSCW